MIPTETPSTCLPPSRRWRLRGSRHEADRVPLCVRLTVLGSPQQRDVGVAVAHGWSNAQISDNLYVGSATVKSHFSSSLTKLGLRDRTQIRARPS